MAYWTKTTTHGPDGEWERTPQFAFTPQEADLLSLAIESAALGAEGVVFTPSEGIRLSRVHAVLDAAADWAEGGDEQ